MLISCAFSLPMGRKENARMETTIELHKPVKSRVFELCLLVSIILIALCTSGCALNYDLTLYNGNVIRAATKPVLNEHGYYVFKDASNRVVEINKLRIRKIEAVNRGSPPSADFR